MSRRLLFCRASALDTVGDEDHDHHEQLDEVKRNDVDSDDVGDQRQQGLDRKIERHRGDGVTARMNANALAPSWIDVDSDRVYRFHSLREDVVRRDFVVNTGSVETLFPSCGFM